MIGATPLLAASTLASSCVIATANQATQKSPRGSPAVYRPLHNPKKLPVLEAAHVPSGHGLPMSSLAALGEPATWMLCRDYVRFGGASGVLTRSAAKCTAPQRTMSSRLGYAGLVVNLLASSPVSECAHPPHLDRRSTSTIWIWAAPAAWTSPPAPCVRCG